MNPSSTSQEKSLVDSDPASFFDTTLIEPQVYKIPPLKANEGHRANEWGDLAQPLWKGRLRIIEKSSSAALYFEDAQTGTIPSTS